MASCPITSWQIEEEKLEAVTDFIFVGSRITVDSDCSREIKQRLLLGRKAMTNLDSILERRNMTLLTKAHIVKAFLPRSKYILISWRQSPSTVILEPTKIKSVTASTFPPSICHEVMGPAALILVFQCWSFKQTF